MRALLSSLRGRLSLAISGLVLLCTALCVIGAVIFLRQALTDRATSDLQRTLSGVSGYMDNQRSDLLGAGKLVADDPVVEQAVQRGDAQTLVVHLSPFYADLNVDVMDIVDARGRVVTRMENTLARGDNVGARPSISAALAGRQVTALESDLPTREAAGGYALRATVPIRSGNSVIGAVVVGRQLGTIFAERIGRALNASINLIAGNQRTGTTLTDSHGLPAAGLQEPTSVLGRIAKGKASIATVVDGGRAELSGLVPLNGANGRPAGAIEVVRPLDPLYDVIRLLSVLLLLLGAVVVALGTALALNISRRLTSRLQVLESTASQVAAMAGMDARLGELPIISAEQVNDEVASLARSFGSMMVALDERMSANATLYGAAQARVRELSGLAEIARLLTAAPSIRQTMDILGQHVCRLVGCSGVAIWLPGEGSVPALHGGHGLPPDYEDLSVDFLRQLADTGFETTAQTAIRTGQIAHRRLIDETPVAGSPSQGELLATMRGLGWNGSTAVPLRVQDRIVGALTCYSLSASPLPESDLSLLSTIADQVAVAVENARLAAEAQERVALEERRLGEEALRASEVRFRTLVEQSPFAIQIFAPDGRSLQVNLAYKRLWDFSDEDLEHFDALENETLSGLGMTPYLERAFAGEAVTVPPVLHAPAPSVASGMVHPRWLRTSIYPVKDEYGEIREVIAVFADITEQREAEELLREKEAQYRSIFESTSDGLIINDLETGVVEANPAVCKMHGYTYDEFVRLKPTAFVHPDYHSTLADFVKTVSAGGTYQTQAVDVRKDGTPFHVEVHGALLMYAGKPRILAVVRDITERVQAYELLEQRVHERTRELSSLLEVSHNVASTLELQPLLGLVLDQLKIVMDYGDAGILEVQGENLQAIGYRGPLPHDIALQLCFPIDPSLPTWPVIERRETVIIDDVRGDSLEAASYRAATGENMDTAYSFVSSFMAVPMILRDTVIGALSVSHPQKNFYTPRHAALAAAIANQAAVAIENARLYEQTTERTRELSTLLEVSRNVASTLELQPLLSVIVDQLKVMVDYTGASIQAVEGDDLVLLEDRAPPEAGVMPYPRFPLEHARAQWDLIARGEPIIIDDVWDETPAARAYRETNSKLMDTTMAYVRSFMAVPLALKDRVIGILSLSSSEPNQYTARHAELVMGIAQQAAIAIENARLYAQAQEVAALEERQRLARELHDSVSQALYGIALGARTARTLLDRDPSKVADPLEYVLAQAEAGLTEMRALIFELRPEALEAEGLVAALTKQVESLRARHGIAVQASLGFEPEVPFIVKEAIYRIAQEALHNTVKHARARSVEIRLAILPDGIELDLCDDGRGFDTGGAFPGHLGLHTMRERTSRLGGSLEIESAPGSGTRIRAKIPVAVGLAPTANLNVR